MSGYSTRSGLVSFTELIAAALAWPPFRFDWRAVAALFMEAPFLCRPLAAAGLDFRVGGRVTASAGLSSRKPSNDGCRSTLASVQPVNATWATRCGLTQRTCGPRSLAGIDTNGLS